MVALVHTGLKDFVALELTRHKVGFVPMIVIRPFVGVDLGQAVT